jgi:hypothetical protein
MEIRNDSVSFGSKIVPNETLKSSFNYVRKGLIPSGNFVKSLNNLLNDGEKDVIEITKKQRIGERPAIVAKVNDKEIISCGYNDNEDIDKVRSVRYCLIELAKKRNPKMIFENLAGYEQKAISSVLEDLTKQVYTKQIKNIEKLPQIIDNTKLKIQEQIKIETAKMMDFLETEIFG